MPVVFKNRLPEKQTLDKQGTLFFFEIDEATRKKVRIEFILDPDKRMWRGNMVVNAFATFLKGWGNLLDEQGKQVPFSIAVRDSLINDPDIFTEEDILLIGAGIDLREVGKQDDSKKKESTSENASGTPLSCTGDQNGASIVSTTPAAKKKRERAAK